MRVCPQGHPVEEPQARFCDTCGASLEAAAAQARCATHPERAAAWPCSRCGTFGCLECLNWVGQQLLCPGCHARATKRRLPWDERERLGTWRAYLRSATALMFSPAQTAEQASPTGTMGSSLLFAALSLLASTLVTAVLYGMAVAALGSMFLPNGETALATPLLMVGTGAGVAAGMIVFTVLAGLAGLLISAGLDHLVLALVGARPQGFDVTLRACALSMAPGLCGLVPFLGLYVFPVWTVILKVVLYKSFHRTTAGRAALGGLLVPGVLTVLFLIAYAVMLALMAAQSPA